MGFSAPIQAVTLICGIAITGLSLLPAVRRFMAE
jgi:hypothetical protein